MVGARERDGELCNMSGNCLEYGHGTATNIEKAAQYFKKGSDDGCSRADWSYGHGLLRGYGVAPNPELAFMLLTRASEAGQLGAKPTLSQCYQLGIGELHSPEAI